MTTSPNQPPLNPFLVLVLIVVCVLLIVGGVTLWLVTSSKPATVASHAPIAPPADHRVPVSGSTSTPTTERITWRPTYRNGQALTYLDKRWFTIGYDERRKNPAWVSYELAGPITFPGREPTRPATFVTDFDTSAHVAHSDYTGSHFDRGHMCPAYAMWSRHGAEAFTASFVCSNIIPQPHAVNAGIWEDLETLIAGRYFSHGGSPASQGWAATYHDVIVINGPIYERPTPETLRTGIAIPTVCFGIVIRHQEGGWDAIAFEIPNAGAPRGPLTNYITTIEQIERDSGLDVFAGDAEGLRASLETKRTDTAWP